ncbi:peptidase M13 [Calidifontibacter sp. DB0510]|uniref:Peptidase M13 n=1 Tax=Metallococcus carri TaxID=1656884 RepID=A0A967B604_9MICO|nr:M13-type metalloendopeptidase [Metallococcus carri]NHN55286.1 peptidase M13 [Metallococcus carri]NOP36363.1 peptidase M13 [Calidifontibacter sp. DB2511S]
MPAEAPKSGIIATLDPSIRPQDDLFGYVNHQWVKDTEIPSDRARYGTFDRLREQSEQAVRQIVEAASSGTAEDGTEERKVGDLYASFMDTEAIERLGSTPLDAPIERIRGTKSVSQLLGVAGELARTGVSGAVVFYVTADAKNPQEYVVYLEQAGIGLPDESYYREESYAEVRDAYVAHIARQAEGLGFEDPQGFAERVMEVETRIARQHWDVVATRDAIKTYNKHTLAELKERAPGYDWDVWLEGLQAPGGSFAQVVVHEPSFLEGLSTALQEIGLPLWQDWLVWRVVTSLAPYLNEQVVDENFDFFGKTLSGTPQLRERWKRGVGLVEDALGEAVGKIYVSQHFPPHAKERMLQLVDNLVEAYRRDFDDLPWMSPQTREKALDKLGKFRTKIGYPDKWRDYSALEVHRDDLVGNVARASAFEVDRELGKIGGPIDRDEWLMSPQTVNAYYHPMMNEIVFPAAILQPPFFDADADDAVNYGGIGAVIGHEIGHGFDDQGSRFAGDGSLTDWWTPQDRERFDALAQKLIEQFNQEEPADSPGTKVNGGLTVGENIGDLGGLTIGYKAYQIAQETAPAPELDGLTGDQRFFIGWAQVWCGKARPEEAKRLVAIDPHAPMNCRANVARNLREFQEVFGVAEGDGMYLAPDDQVRIF